MTPKEKAKQLLWKYLPLIEGWTAPEKTDLAKKLALVCIDEIQTFIPCKTYKDTISPYDGSELSTDYWDEVRCELSLL